MKSTRSPATSGKKRSWSVSDRLRKQIGVERELDAFADFLSSRMA